VVAALLDRDAPGGGVHLDEFGLLRELDLLGGDDLRAVLEGLPGRPPGAGQVDAVGWDAGEFANRDLQRPGDGNHYEHPTTNKDLPAGERDGHYRPTLSMPLLDQAPE